MYTLWNHKVSRWRILHTLCKTWLHCSHSQACKFGFYKSDTLYDCDLNPPTPGGADCVLGRRVLNGLQMYVWHFYAKNCTIIYCDFAAALCVCVCDSYGPFGMWCGGECITRKVWLAGLYTHTSRPPTSCIYVALVIMYAGRMDILCAIVCIYECCS